MPKVAKKIIDDPHTVAKRSLKERERERATNNRRRIVLKVEWGKNGESSFLDGKTDGD